MKMYIDTHAHYDHKKFDGDRHFLLNQMINNKNYKIINPAISYESNYIMRQTLSMYPFIYYGVGVHPNRLMLENDLDGEWEAHFRKLAIEARTVAIGETGLDYYRVSSLDMRRRQAVWFEKQLQIAQDFSLPLILHIREAKEDAIPILKNFALKKSGVAHCFGEDTKTAQKYIDMGLYLGIGGRVTYEQEKDLRDAITNVPLEYIVLETDCPFIRPDGFKGVKSSSLMLPVIAQSIADLKGVSVEEVAAITKKNAEKLFWG